ncbi:MAG: Hsp20/alpha crystallin family protein [Halobacteria archaeon]
MVEISLRKNKDSLLRRIGKRLPTSADMLESDDEFLVLINVPGCDEDDIDLRFVKGSLKVNAERSETHEGYAPVREERPARISETVPVPDDVDVEGAEATYENGVLHITLPKAGGEAVEEEEDFREVGVTETEGSEEDEDTDEAETEEDEGGEETDDEDLPSSREELEDMSYRNLQGVAKEVGVKANQSTEDLVDGIADELDL